MKLIFIIFFLFVIIVSVKSQTNCHKIPFHLTNHIRNLSLEQAPYYCFTTIYPPPDISHLPMSDIIPSWHLPTSDYTGVKYFGECSDFKLPFDVQDYLRNSNIMPIYLPYVPLPIPDGKGVLGFLSDRSLNGSPSSDTFIGKEYISSNLNSIIKKDSLYRLSFDIGFGIKDTSGIAYNGGKVYYISASPTKFEIFGLADSSHLPFPKPQGNHNHFGCLSQINHEWISLGTTIVNGNPGTWVKTSIDFVAPINIQSIGIGPACDFTDVPYTKLSAEERNFFYFLDNLQFFQASAPKPLLEVSAGSFCDGPNASLTLHMKSDAFYKGSQLQWYKNNTAIPETGGSVTITKNQYGEGWYQCGVQNDSVCIRSDSFQVFWDPFINATIGNHPDTTACNGDTVLLAVAGGNHANYLWSDGSYSSSIRVSQSGYYSVSASNACNTVTAVKNILFADCPPQLFVPSAFTPNHDGLNDVFRAFYKGKVNTFSLSVYNRYGQRIFFSNEISKGWDGSFQRKQQDSGTYVWVVQYTDGNNIPHTDKGTILLLR
jgi:gliding motility-associated-like protein